MVSSVIGRLLYKLDTLRLIPFQAYHVCSSLIAKKIESPELSIILQISITDCKWYKLNWFPHVVFLNQYHNVDFILIFICFLRALYRLNSLVQYFANYAYALPSIICMHIFRGSLVYIMWESNFVIYFTLHTKDHKVWPSLVLLISFFSVFDSKEENLEDQKQALICRTKSPIIIICKW